VTQNGDDFRKLATRSEIHPGLIILPPLDRDGSYRVLWSALAFVKARGDPMQVMVNHALESDESATCRLYELPTSND